MGALHTSGVLTLPAYSCAACPHTSGILTRRSYSHFRCTYVPLILTLLAYLHTAHPHTSGVLTCSSYSHFRRTYVPLVLTLPAYLRAARTHTPYMGSLSLRYLSHPVCSSSCLYLHALHDIVSLLTRLAWARCSRGIRHAQHGLIVVFSHVLHGIVVLVMVGGHSAGSWVER